MTGTAAQMSAPPAGDDLLRLERIARHGGSGLSDTDLEGCWRLEQIWPRGSGQPASLSGALLRALGAELTIALRQEGLWLSNAVRLGTLQLRFQGPGWLLGSRPLLQFRFESVELTLAGLPLLRRPLSPPPPRRMPFFALITRSEAGWLAARGRGGGLALWRRTAAGPSPAPHSRRRSDAAAP